jgi:small subunit ribosomal protein S6
VNQYEVVYIFDSAVPESNINEKLERFHALVAGNGGGEVTAVDHWGRRQLAYPIRKKGAGYYVVVHLRTTPDRLPEFERLLKLEEELLRYLIVVNEGEPTQPMSLATRQVRRREDGDEDEEGGDEEEE